MSDATTGDSRMIGYWGQPGQAGARSSRSAKIAIVNCPKCGHEFRANGLWRHQAMCDGGLTKSHKRLIDGHNLCACSRLKLRVARCCWTCEDKDPGFAILDALIAAGIDTPRKKLYDDPRSELWALVEEMKARA